MLSKSKDLILIDIVLINCILLPLLGATDTVLRLLFALPLVFILPGYTFVEAFVKPHLEAVERWAIILGVSLGLTMLVGFVLNQSTIGLQFVSWALLLGSLCFLFAQIAFIRRFFSTRSKAGISPAEPRSRLEPLTVVLMIGSALLIWGTISFAQFGVASSSSAFTQFWMLPASSPGAVATTTPQTSNTPAPSGQPEVLTIGVKSMEKDTVQYRVVVQEGSQVLREWQGISLQPGETWQEQISIPAGVSQTTPVQAFLYRADSPSQVYRTVNWWPQAGQ
jgi:uncharacterized membrane protein